MLMKKRHFTKEEIARALRAGGDRNRKEFSQEQQAGSRQERKKGARLPPGPTSRVCGEIQLKRRPGSERGRCSVFASGMSQGLRLDAQERHCAEPA